MAVYQSCLLQVSILRLSSRDTHHLQWAKKRRHNELPYLLIAQILYICHVKLDVVAYKYSPTSGDSNVGFNIWTVGMMSVWMQLHFWDVGQQLGHASLGGFPAPLPSGLYPSLHAGKSGVISLDMTVSDDTCCLATGHKDGTMSIFTERR